jgi:hypothetical protein
MILWIDGTFRIPESVRRARVRVIREKIEKMQTRDWTQENA